ncbi:MAG: aspartate kinase [Planctomycetota bacterium]
MIVMKFGGTSVGSAKSIRDVCAIVRGRHERHPLVVTSAHGKDAGHGKITDMLIAAAHAALEGNPDSGVIEARQLGLIRDLGLDASLVRPLLDNLAELLKGISMVEELTPRTLDYVQSFGERMAARVVAAQMQQEGMDAIAVDSFDLGLRTDARYGAANPAPDCYAEMKKRWAEIEAEIVVTTGFVAKCPDGHITTLGRGGSDYSATIFGAALGAEEVEIWTDVNGVMTADPGIVPASRSLPELTFNEASELAWYGAQVLHPSTILPAVDAGVPVRVLNTMAPEQSGTVILPDSTEKANVAKSVVYKEDLTLIDITSSRMLMSHGFMAKVFHIFEKHEIVINMIATSEVTISLTSDAPAARLEPAVAELETYGAVNCKPAHAIICLIGEGMGGIIGTAGRMCRALAEAKVNIQMISQGAREINIAVCVDNNDIEPAVRALHAEFFETA